MNAPTISIVTATRNRTDLLERTLRSIADQTFTDYEAIVVDDGSSADVQRFQRDLVATLGDRFRLLSSPAPDLPGTGCSAARNRGAQAARGTFLAFLDDDDRWILPDHLAVAVDLMARCEADYFVSKIQGEANGEVVAKEIYSEYLPTFQADRVISHTPLVYKISRTELVRMKKHVFIHPNNTVVRRTVFDAIGGFVNHLKWCEDLNLMMRIADVSRLTLYRPAVSVSYRFSRGDSVSFTYDEVEKCLHSLNSAHQLRATCRTSAVRKSALEDEAWSLRRMSKLLAEQGGHSESFRFAWQAFWSCATFGAARDLIISLLQYLSSRVFGSARSGATQRDH